MPVERRFKISVLNFSPEDREFAKSLSIDSDSDFFYYEIGSDNYHRALGKAGYVYPIPKPQVKESNQENRPKKKCGGCKRSKN